MRGDVFVYISGPITAKVGHTVEDNVADGLRVLWQLLKLGIPAFCPHLSAAFPTAWTLLDYDEWLAYDFAVIDRCSHVLLMPRWEMSTGARAEREYALKQGIPVVEGVHALLYALNVVTEGIS